MSDDDLLSFLRSWRPDPREFRMGKEGLRLALVQAVEGNPDRFVDLSERLRELEPTFVRGVVDGLVQASKNDKAFPWEGALAIAEWCAAKEPGVAEDWNAHAEQDRNWGSTHGSVLDLINVGLAGGGLRPEPLREQAIRILGTLAVPPVDEPERPSGGVSPRFWWGHTTCGRALAAVIDLIRREGLVPGARAILERHLDPTVDSSPSSRAVYGQNLHALLNADEGWTVERLPTIFPGDASAPKLRIAAWEAYMLFNQPHPNAFALLRPLYDEAVNNLNPEMQSEFGDWSPERALAEHFMMLYNWGTIGPEKGGPLDRFFRKAPLKLRARALEFEGRVLAENASLPDDVTKRMRALMEWRLGYLEADGLAEAREELGSCGYWFSSGKLAPAWNLPALERCLALAPDMEHDYSLMEFLAGTASTEPLATVRCVQRMVTAQTEEWRPHAWLPHLREIISKALASGVVEAQGAARELANRLIARGLRQLLDVLKEEAKS
jgi:hypothetical protein